MVARRQPGRITASARHDVMLALPPALQLAGNETWRPPGRPPRPHSVIVGSVRTHNRRGQSVVRQCGPRRHGYSPEDDMCQHQPRCPDALAPDRTAAHVTVSYPEQGWSLLCNGIVLFDDAGALLPDGQAVVPPTVAPLLAAA